MNALEVAKLGFTFLSAVTAARGATACVSPANPPQSGATSPPPSALAGFAGAKFVKTADGQFSMRAEYTLQERSVYVTSYHLGSGPRPPKILQEYRTSYWPTYVATLDQGVLCVAGKGARQGNTVIEVWRFDPPVLQGAVNSPPTFKAGVLRSVDEVYNALTPGRDLVEDILPVWGGAGHRILVRFFDSKDVYTMDLSSGAIALVASPTQHAGAFHVPFLSNATSAWARELTQGGYVYCFFRKGVSDPSAVSQAWLLDSNKDGVIESASTLTGQQFTTGGYDLASAWLPTWW